MYFSIYCCKNGCVSFLNVCDVIFLYVDLNVIYMCGCMDAGAVCLEAMKTELEGFAVSPMPKDC